MDREFAGCAPHRCVPIYVQPEVPASASVMRVVEQILTAGHMDQEDLAALRCAFETEAPAVPAGWPTDDAVDEHLDKVLRAAGSGLHCYSVNKRLIDMRNAMHAAMLAAAPTAPAVEAPPKMTDEQRTALIVWRGPPNDQHFDADEYAKAVESARDRQWRAALGGKV